MNHAIGKPATTSTTETKIAMMNEAEMANVALEVRFGPSKTCPIRFHLSNIPSIGGIKIIAKKKMAEDE